MTFLPGQSWNGNRRGRPRRGKAMADLLRRGLAEPYLTPEGVLTGQTCAERIAEVCIESALEGNLWAAQWIVDRTEGKAPERLEHSGPGGGPQRLTFRIAHPTGAPVESPALEEHADGRLPG